MSSSLCKKVKFVVQNYKYPLVSSVALSSPVPSSGGASFLIILIASIVV
jgi:hypothetical protein